jgi:predicted lysophospholipase L1 biosynthesis ABC-type transport system permease subunit
MVARGLRITRSTNGLLAAISAGVTANATVAVTQFGIDGKVGLLAIVFASIALSTYAVCVDILNRSSQTVANLRSIGADRGAISRAVLVFVLTYGSAGSILGVAIGTALGATLSSFAISTSVLFDMISVFVASAMGTAIGVYAGARQAWRS